MWNEIKYLKTHPLKSEFHIASSVVNICFFLLSGVSVKLRPMEQRQAIGGKQKHFLLLCLGKETQKQNAT